MCTDTACLPTSHNSPCVLYVEVLEATAEVPLLGTSYNIHPHGLHLELLEVVGMCAHTSDVYK